MKDLDWLVYMYMECAGNLWAKDSKGTAIVH